MPEETLLNVGHGDIPPTGKTKVLIGPNSDFHDLCGFSDGRAYFPSEMTTRGLRYLISEA